MNKSIMEQMDELGLTDVGEFIKLQEDLAEAKFAERWLPVLGYEDLYEVSDYGRVRNADGKILKPQPYGGRREYRGVNLSRHSKQKVIGIHRLVAECFIGLPTDLNPDGTPMRTTPEINHKDGNPANNYYTNLEWCDRYYNNAHRVDRKSWNFKKTGRAPVQHSSKFCQKQIDYFTQKIADLEHENTLLVEGNTPETIVHTHSFEFLYKRMGKNLGLIKDYKEKIDKYQEEMAVAIDAESREKKAGGIPGKPIITVSPSGEEQEWKCARAFTDAIGVAVAGVYQCLSGRQATFRKYRVSWKK